MPGNSWRRITRDRSVGRGSKESEGVKSDLVASNIRETNPRLNELMKEREALEHNLRNVLDGPQSDAREAARFQVPTFAQRQAEQRQWEHQHDSQRFMRLAAIRDQRTLSATPLVSFEEKIRTGLRDFQQPARGWLEERDQDRQRLRDSAREYTDRIDQTTKPLKQLGSQVRSSSEQLRDLDRKLASEGLESDREELRKLGTDKIHQANKTFGKANAIVDAPSTAVKKIDDFWQKRNNEINGAMDRFGPYVENARRRLSVNTGGSGDLFERMQQNRERALERRREQRRQEMRDQTRRERAQQKRKEKAQEEN